MGLLSEGSPLSWSETKKWAEHVRRHGIQQFINQYHKLKDRSNDTLKWGDEVEYMLVKLNAPNKKAQLLLKAGQLLPTLQKEELSGNRKQVTTLWRPEYAAYMIEGTPGDPYGHLMAHFNMVEANMKLRREQLQRLLKEPGEIAISLTAFPRLGCPNFTEPSHKPSITEGASRSLFYPEQAIFQGHPRFSTLTRNIRERKGQKVIINMPVYKDVNTPKPFVEDFSILGDDGEAQREAKPDHVYMDCMGFGMGCSCLQMTFQACSIQEARHLYDQLAPLTSIVMCMSASTPILRGYLLDTDCRWNVIAASVDCRTREERGIEPLKENKFLISKSRYDSIDCYLSPCSEKYNDVDLVYDEELYQTMVDSGIDKLLAQHVAHLFIRDPVSLFSERIHQNDETDTDHFENIQSTNWQNMRFKPPPPNSTIGWRVEFRPTEVQLTDFENAAFVVFVVLLTRVILSYHLDLVIPISKVDENMKKAHKRDAVRTEKFYFKKDITTVSSPPEAEAACSCIKRCPASSEYTQMSIDEIINGKEDEFPGLVPLMYDYLNNVECDVDTRCTIQQYLNFIQKKASGEIMTTARWMREFVQNHPDYKQDSVVSETINYDLLKFCDDLTNGRAHCPKLLPAYNTKSTDGIPLATQKAEVYLQNMSQRRHNGSDVHLTNSLEH